MLTHVIRHGSVAWEVAFSIEGEKVRDVTVTRRVLKGGQWTLPHYLGLETAGNGVPYLKYSIPQYEGGGPGPATHTVKVGDYLDGSVKKFVKEAAQALGIKVPSALWYRSQGR